GILRLTVFMGSNTSLLKRYYQTVRMSGLEQNGGLDRVERSLATGFPFMVNQDRLSQTLAGRERHFFFSSAVQFVRIVIGESSCGRPATTRNRLPSFA